MISRIPLRLKLIGAFALLVGLGGGITYWLAEHAVRESFQAFSLQSGIIQAYQLQQAFADYYEHVGSWRGVEHFFNSEGPPPGLGMRYRMGLAMFAYQANLILANEDGIVLLAPDPQLLGQKLLEETLIAGVPVNVAGRRVGTLLAGSLENIFSPLEQTFLDSLHTSILTAGVIATLAAIGLGALLLRQLTVPLRRLVQATEQISIGNAGPRLPVPSHDELGQLSAAFNRMAERLEQSERLRRQMIADIAHELRTPLTVIQGNLQAILDGVYEPTPEVIASIHEESSLLARLVSDLRELSLAEAGELHLEKQLTDIREVIRQTVTVLEPSLESKRITLRVELPQEPVVVKIDPQRIKQVLFNLLNNAERYTPEGGQIGLSVARSENEIRVSVSDTGPGIAPEDLPYVFERFWRADRSRSRATGGSGLGLAIAKHFIEAHGGTIWAESAPGHGATFTFSLPLS
uniref:histidine kinase n=1 Tax=Acetithermum autotrophicum TaxID=1446466 RepID=H5SQU9_ACEAU|nr:sensor histidine kinase [Candidatus Acetothermum autotrophicum]